MDGNASEGFLSFIVCSLEAIQYFPDSLSTQLEGGKGETFQHSLNPEYKVFLADEEC